MQARLAIQLPTLKSSALIKEVQPTSTHGSAPPPVQVPKYSSDAVIKYQMQVMQPVKALLDSAEIIGGEVLNATRVLVKGFSEELHIVQAFSQCQRPTGPELQQLTGPVGEQLMAASTMTSGPRSPYLMHFKLIAEAMQGLTWVVYQGPSSGMSLPAQHVQDCWSAAEFYANKVLMEWRAKDPQHVTWVQAVKQLLLALQDFCKQCFPNGPTWNASGVPVTQFKPDSALPATTGFQMPAAPPKAPPVQPAGGPPPPPPPPPGGPGSLIKELPATAPTKQSGPNMSALFAEINKGEVVASGLRKVTADMKTKNRADRSGAVPAAPSVGSKPAVKSAGATNATHGPPRIECEQDRKWVVENQNGNREIIISDTQPRHTVYIYNCHNSTVQIRGKVNAISMDKCRRTGLLFEDVVASCEVVNCASVEIQCTGSVPTVAVDKCDGCQVYLSRESLGTDITTAKSSEVNVVVPGETEDSDPLESAIPEQFVTRFKQGRWVTEAVSHSAA